MNGKAKEAYTKAGNIGKQNSEPLLACYQSILDAAVAHDKASVESGIGVLEKALNPHANPKLAYHLTYLYEYMRWCLGSERYDEVARISQGLKTLWDRAISLHNLPEDPNIKQD
jgi:flagellin-specific chaperone FliS